MDARINAAVIVLAAGDSARMGSPKSLLDWHGRALIEHVLHAAREGGCTSAIVVLGRDADLVRQGAQLGDAKVIVNPDPSRGQLSSLQLAMRGLDFRTDCCVVWPVDCPLVKPGDVRALIAAYAAQRARRMRIFLPVYEGARGHPMLVDIGFRQPFMELPEGASARAVIDANAEQVAEVATDNPGVLVDIDTPEEYAKAMGE